jgi:hypothetical protein
MVEDRREVHLLMVQWLGCADPNRKGWTPHARL